MTNQTSSAWIFQANPQRFDIGAFVANPPEECEWLVSRYNNQIGPGQRVFLWCAAGDADIPSGVFAEARTISSVRERRDDGDQGLWKDPAEADLVRPRVRLALTRIANKREVIKRDWWQGDPALNDHLIMTMPNHTTFRIDGQAYDRLDRLWSKTGSDWTYEDAVGGLYAFVETLGKPVSKLPGSIIADVAMVVGRPVTGIYNKVMNFRSLDPSDPRKGFTGASGQDQTVWNKFYVHSAGLDHEAVRAEYARLWSLPTGLQPSVSGGRPPSPGQKTRNLSRELFEAEFAWFKAEIARVSNRPFQSFRDGLLEEWEGYKPILRAEALNRLDLSSWTEDAIGSGLILDHAIRAIEINGPGALKNNLVGWQNQYGHASRSHKALLDAQGDASRLPSIERLLFDFFRVGMAEETAFERFKAAGVKSYDLTAYLFFLTDSDRYMPIRPMTFDQVLRRLGFEFSTTSRCSVENYAQYNNALREVREALAQVPGLDDVRLIDAHSFCWVLGRIAQEKTSRPAPRRGKASGVTYDARRLSIYMMVDNAFAAAKAGNGQVVERVMKNKEVRMSQLELEAYVAELIDKQDGRCALTGLALQFQKEHEDEQLLASLDRIDSDGHYEAGNLQVVCRFANRWKSDAHTDEFVRLLSLVRESAR